MRYAFVDGDILAFKASSAVQKDIDWGDGLWTCHAEVDDAWDYFTDMLIAIDEKLNKHFVGEEITYVFCFSDEDNFRKSYNPDYKSNRRSNRKPCCYKGLVDKIKETYISHTVKYLEADDVVGIYCTSPVYKDICVAVSMDKDFKTIPGYFYDFGNDVLHSITEKDSKKWLCYQTLVGDVTDGYKGCPTYGPVKANKLLNGHPDSEWWSEVLKAFKSQGLTEEDAIREATMARILHYEDYPLNESEGLPKKYNPF